MQTIQKRKLKSLITPKSVKIDMPLTCLETVHWSFFNKRNNLGKVNITNSLESPIQSRYQKNILIVQFYRQFSQMVKFRQSFGVRKNFKFLEYGCVINQLEERDLENQNIPFISQNIQTFRF